jgi:hypothetical protein
MQKMIFGIGPNPMAEDSDFKVSPFSVYVCDKITWEKDGHCNDSCVDQKMREKLEKVGFAESMESIFEPCEIRLTEEMIRAEMEGLGYVYNEDFAKFMESSFG